MQTVNVPGCPAGEKIDKVVEIIVPPEAEPSLHGTLFSLNHVLECTVVQNTADKFTKNWKYAILDFIVQVAPPSDDCKIKLDKHYLAQETPLPKGWNPMVFPLQYNFKINKKGEGERYDLQGCVVEDCYVDLVAKV